jgi:hypothetical protein
MPLSFLAKLEKTLKVDKPIKLLMSQTLRSNKTSVLHKSVYKKESHENKENTES